MNYLQMKTKIQNLKTFLLILLPLYFLLLGIGCKKEKEEPQLPAETQTGANTFGCYVNDKLLVSQSGYGYFGSPNPLAIYTRVNNRLELYGAGKNGIININVRVPKEQSDSLLFEMNYSTIQSSVFYVADIDESNRGKIYITKLDTINKIASGIFSDIMLKIRGGNDSVIITQGRFDLKLMMYND